MPTLVDKVLGPWRFPPPRCRGPQEMRLGIIIEKTGEDNLHSMKTRVMKLFSRDVRRESGVIVCSKEWFEFEVGDWVTFVAENKVDGDEKEVLQCQRVTNPRPTYFSRFGVLQIEVHIMLMPRFITSISRLVDRKIYYKVHIFPLGPGFITYDEGNKGNRLIENHVYTAVVELATSPINFCPHEGMGPLGWPLERDALWEVVKKSVEMESRFFNCSETFRSEIEDLKIWAQENAHIEKVITDEDQLKKLTSKNRRGFDGFYLNAGAKPSAVGFGGMKLPGIDSLDKISKRSRDITNDTIFSAVTHDEYNDSISHFKQQNRNNDLNALQNQRHFYSKCDFEASSTEHLNGGPTRFATSSNSGFSQPQVSATQPVQAVRPLQLDTTNSPNREGVVPRFTNGNGFGSPNLNTAFQTFPSKNPQPENNNRSNGRVISTEEWKKTIGEIISTEQEGRQLGGTSRPDQYLKRRDSSLKEVFEARNARRSNYYRDKLRRVQDDNSARLRGSVNYRLQEYIATTGSRSRESEISLQNSSSRIFDLSDLQNDLPRPEENRNEERRRDVSMPPVARTSTPMFEEDDDSRESDDMVRVTRHEARTESTSFRAIHRTRSLSRPPEIEFQFGGRVQEEGFPRCFVESTQNMHFPAADQHNIFTLPPQQFVQQPQQQFYQNPHGHLVTPGNQTNAHYFVLPAQQQQMPFGQVPQQIVQHPYLQPQMQFQAPVGYQQNVQYAMPSASQQMNQNMAYYGQNCGVSENAANTFNPQMAPNPLLRYDITRPVPTDPKLQFFLSTHQYHMQS
ncbi:unnamed protein product [Caenorhabditis auriculariae]|uniref:Uncharacterized protein n=1 Tax=Caenorhabditis auriculariae TaxID=2777116 RepID=A0A8S1GTL3_9PELO|nr:unnamed protein product [Caenorhabditis auriculariae]